MKQKAVFLKHKMKTRLLFLMLSFLSLTVSGQYGTISFCTQEEVDNYDPSLETIQNPTIYIDGISITDLSSLNGKLSSYSIGLSISNTSLVDLDGLQDLTSAFGDTGGFSTGGFLVIEDNAYLESLLGLGNLRRTGNVTIKNNPKLVNTTSLNLSSILSGSWQASSGLDFYTTPGVIIENNAELQKLSGLNGFVNGAFLMVKDNPKLQSLITFRNLESLCRTGYFYDPHIGSLIIENNDALTSLEGLENFNDVCGKVEISDNDSLLNIGLEGDILVRSFEVHNNMALTELGDFSLRRNTSNCANCSIANLFTMGITITDNASLESIDLIDVTHLSFSGYEQWMYTLFKIENNPQLGTCNVDYLCNSIANIPNDIHRISNNNEGCNDTGQVIQTCCDYKEEWEVFNFYSDQKICGIDYFIKLNNCKAELDFSTIKFYYSIDSSLTEFYRFSDINQAMHTNDTLVWDLTLEDFDVYHIPVTLKFFKEFPSNVPIEVKCEVFNSLGEVVLVETLYEESDLSNSLDLSTQDQVDRCSCYTSVSSLELDSNRIFNLDSLINLTRIGNNLTIYTDSLTNLVGLNSLNFIGRALYVSGAESLESFQGLNSLEYIGDGLSIWRSDNLKSLDGLENVEFLTGKIDIYENDELNSISALSPLTKPNKVEIEGNKSLSACATEFLCFLNNDPSIEVLIDNNDLGCKNPIEAFEECENFNDVRIDFVTKEVACNSTLVEIIITNASNEPIEADFSLTSENSNLIEQFQFLNLSNGVELNDSIIWDDILVESFTREVVASLVIKVDEEFDELDSIPFRLELNFDDDNLGNNQGQFTATSFESASHLILDRQLEVDMCSCIKSIEGNLEIFETTEIENLDSLYNLESIAGSLRIERNTALRSTSGISGLANLGGSFSIIWNDELNDLGSFESLRELDGSITINGNDSLVSLASFESLEIIGGDLSIESNASLLRIPSFSSLLLVNGDLNIEGNIAIVSLMGLDNLTQVDGTVVIRRNELLEDVSALRSLMNVGGSLDINDNDFLESLDGLQNLEFLGNDLIIYSNNILSSLSPLIGFTSILGSLDIGFNNSLSSLSGLQNIESIVGNLIIDDNHQLQSLSGLDGLRSIGEDLRIETNDHLLTLNGLGNLEYVGGEFNLFRNENLIQIATLHNLREIGDRLNIASNFNLESLHGLNRIQRIGTDLWITNNGKLSSLVGLEKLEIIQEDLSIRENRELQSLKGLESLSIIGEDLNVSSNELLKTMEGLEKIDSIGIKMYVGFNNQLESLNGIESLNFAREIEISRNPLLSSIQALNVSNIPERLEITNNVDLNLCASSFICSIIDNASVDLLIENNGLGCNNVDDIKVSCGNLVFFGKLEIADTCTFLFDTLYSSFAGVQIIDSLSGLPLVSTDAHGNFGYYSDSNPLLGNNLVVKPDPVLGFESSNSSYFIQNFLQNSEIDSLIFDYCPVYFSDLSVSIPFVEEDLLPGELVEYSLCLTNNGSIDDEGIMEFRYDDLDSLRNYLEFIDVDDALINDYELSWNFASLKPGETICKLVVVKISEDFPLGNVIKPTLFVESNLNFEISNPADNLYLIEQSIGLGDLNVEITSIKSQCINDYNITVSNDSGNEHHADSLKVYFDSSLRAKYIFTDLDGAELVGDTLIWFLPELFPGELVTFDISLRVNNNISSSDYFSMNAELSGIDFDNSNNMISYQADVTTFDGQLDLLSQSHINPCSCIREVNGQVVIHGIEGEINNLDSLQNLESINGELYIEASGMLTSLDRFSNLNNLNSLYLLRSNLESLRGLEGIKNIQGIKILNCDNLTSLRGLGNIDTLGQELLIRYNDGLNTIMSLNPSSWEIDDLRIDHNTILRSCTSDFICTLLEEDFGVDNIMKSIKGNLDDCHTDWTLLNACGISSLDNHVDSHNIRIFPNPASDHVYIESDRPLGDFNINLKTINGQTLKVLNKGDFFMDVSTYPSGLYLISIESEEMSMVKKVVIN